jgi:hypothetical protein
MAVSRKCPVCRVTQLNDFKEDPQNDRTLFDCDLCGQFFIVEDLLISLEAQYVKVAHGPAKLSHAVRRMQKTMKRPTLHWDNVRSILNASLPSVREQINNLVTYFAEELDGPGRRTHLFPVKHQGIVGSSSVEGFALVVFSAFQEGLLNGSHSRVLELEGRGAYALSAKGWEYYEKLQREGFNTRKAFMAMKFGDPDLDQMLHEVFRPAVEATGFSLRKLDDEPKAGLIDDRMNVEIRTSRFVIADLTHGNNGAYWEAGFAEGLGRPVIYTCEKKKFEEVRTHFDTNHRTTVIWDLDDKSGTMEKLKATIRATLPGEAILEDKS